MAAFRVKSIILCFLGSLIFLGPALFNGFPLVYSDTGVYLLISYENAHIVLSGRSPFYGFYLWMSRLGWSTNWLPAWGQCLILAALLRILVSELGIKRRANAWCLVLYLVLAFGSGAAWYSSQLMPDIFTSFLALSLYFLIFRGESLALSRSCQALYYGLCGLCFFSLLIHIANPLITAGALGVLVVMKLGKRLLVPAQLLLAAVFVLTLAAETGTRNSPYSRSTPVFLVNRLIATGLLTRLLDEHCQDYPYQLCPFREELKTYAPTQYLWDPGSPLNRNRLMSQNRSMPWKMVLDVWHYYPLDLILDVLSGWGRQFFQVESGEGLQAYADNEPVTAFLWRYNPQDARIFSGSRQERNQLTAWASRFNLVQVPLTWLSLAALLLFSIREIYRRRPGLPSFTSLFLLTNAFVCATFSIPSGRYQGRVAWLALCVVFLTVAKGLERKPCALRFKALNYFRNPGETR